MSEALASSLGIVAYLALFAFVGLVFLFANLVVGRLLRPQDPVPEKLEIYECGEPTIGSSFVQFDLRFYVVALLFIIFDVEVAFFFPWATVFGKATNLADAPMVTRSAEGLVLTPAARGGLRELGVTDPEVPTVAPAALAPAVEQRFGAAQATEVTSEAAANFVAQQSMRTLAWLVVVDILVFFGVLMVGFLYVWKRGDLDWVRAVTRERAVARLALAEPRGAEQEAVLSL